MGLRREPNTQIESVSTHPTWEVLGVIMSFFWTANGIPELANTILDRYADAKQIPWAFKIVAIAIYFVLLVAIGYWIFRARTRPHRDTLDLLEQRADRAIRRAILVTYLKRFPISLIADLICRYYRIWSYDVFNRHSNWPQREEFFPKVARFRATERTIEFQFPRSFKAVEVRETEPSSDAFGNPSLRKWSELEYKFLIVTSWFGLYWLIRHLLKMAFRRAE